MQSFQVKRRFKAIYLFSTTLLATICCPAQQQKIDSLKAILPVLKDTARTDCLNQLSYEYIQLENNDSANRYNDSARSLAKQQGYIHGIAVSLAYKAQMAKHFDDDFVKAEAFGKEALYWFNRTKNLDGLDNAYYYLIYTVFSQSKFDEAFEYSRKRYEYAKQTGDSSAMLDDLGFMFAIKRQSGNYEQALSYAQQCYEFASKRKDKIQIASALYGMAQLYELIEDYPNALRYFRQVWQMYDAEVRNNFIATDDDIWLKMEFTEVFAHLYQFDSAWHYYNLFKPDNKKAVYMRVWWVSTGECYLLQKEYALALQNFQLGLAAHRKLNDRNEVMRALLDIGKTYLALNNNQEALRFGREGLSIAIETKAKTFIRDGYQILFVVYDRLHQTDTANLAFRHYITMKDEVLNDQAKGKFAAYDYNQRMALINKEKEVQQARFEKDSFVKEVLVAGLGLLFILALIVVWNISLKRKNERENLEYKIALQRADSEKTKAELQQQASELEMKALRAQMNPHFIFNSLNSINRFILQNDKLQASQYLTKFSKLVRLILQNSQASLISLETELETLSLYLELEALRFNNHFDYAINAGADVDMTALKLPPLIIQPYVENAIWHGLMHKEEKGHLAITISHLEDWLLCKIVDDGIGRKKAAELKSRLTTSQKSFGMHITAQRIGLLQQEKAPGIFIRDLMLPDGTAGGTEVILKIPVLYD